MVTNRVRLVENTEERYSGTPLELLRRRYFRVLTAFELCEVNTSNTEVMLQLLETNFLTTRCILFH